MESSNYRESTVHVYKEPPTEYYKVYKKVPLRKEFLNKLPFDNKSGAYWKFLFAHSGALVFKQGQL